MQAVPIIGRSRAWMADQCFSIGQASFLRYCGQNLQCASESLELCVAGMAHGLVQETCPRLSQEIASIEPPRCALGRWALALTPMSEQRCRCYTLFITIRAANIAHRFGGRPSLPHPPPPLRKFSISVPTSVPTSVRNCALGFVYYFTARWFCKSNPT